LVVAKKLLARSHQDTSAVVENKWVRTRRASGNALAEIVEFMALLFHF
ncbi:MAG: hypothetical protein JWM42_3601, partial [Burkholderia sp.]|nr:hypothetical protein [Burkholderia sp.]